MLRKLGLRGLSSILSWLVAGSIASAIVGCSASASVDRKPKADAGAGRASDGGAADGGHGDDAGHKNNPGRDAGRNDGGQSSDAGRSADASASADASTGDADASSCADAAASCNVSTTCPATGNACVTPTCDAHCCGVKNVASGTLVGTQTAHDCKQLVCNGLGATTHIADDSDLPDDLNPCTADHCSAGTPSHSPQAGACTLASAPAVCGDIAGAAASTCVACNVTQDCTGTDVCMANTCVVPSCMDQIKDGSETDTDCGGTCPPCANTKGCGVAGDCVYQYCKSGICTMPSCTDSVQNGNETDVDCGGTSFKGYPGCPACPDDSTCAANTDCLNYFCNTLLMPHVCKTPSCTDTVRNGQETGVDCGGTTCDGLGKTCAPPSACNNANDCTSGYCNNNACALKPLGLYCGAGSECTSTLCVDSVCCNNACTGTCQACSAAKKNNGLDGTCGTVLGGTDPDNECTKTSAALCGTDGYCSNAGSCELWSSSTSCGSGMMCDGAGSCL